MIAALDLALLDVLAAARSPALDVFFAGVTWAGSLWLLMPAGLALLAVGGWAVRRRALPLASLALAATAAHALKLVIDRPRPALHASLQGLPVDASFPSAHAAQATAFFVAMWLVLPPPARRRWALPLIAAIAVVGLSRLYLQVHWPSDVVAGTLIGLCAALAAARLGRQGGAT